MKSYSYSSLECFQNCPQQFKFKYLDHLKTETEFIEAFLGRRVHEALEKFYFDLEKGKLTTRQELLDIFSSSWGKYWHKDIKVVKSEYTSDDYRYLGERCINDFYHQYFPFVDSETIALEEKFKFCLGENNRQYQFTGFIDRLAKGYDGVLEVHDYKTSLTLPSIEKLNENRQLALYYFAVKNRFPTAQEIRLVWHFLAFKKKLSLIFTPEILNRAQKDIFSIIDKIETTNKFLPRKSVLCKWCGYTQTCR